MDYKGKFVNFKELCIITLNFLVEITSNKITRKTCDMEKQVNDVKWGELADKFYFYEGTLYIFCK